MNRTPADMGMAELGKIRTASLSDLLDVENVITIGLYRPALGMALVLVPASLLIKTMVGLFKNIAGDRIAHTFQFYWLSSLVPSIFS